MTSFLQSLLALLFSFTYLNDIIRNLLQFGQRLKTLLSKLSKTRNYITSIYKHSFFILMQQINIYIVFWFLNIIVFLLFNIINVCLYDCHICSALLFIDVVIVVHFSEQGKNLKWQISSYFHISFSPISKALTLRGTQ